MGILENISIWWTDPAMILNDFWTWMIVWIPLVSTSGAWIGVKTLDYLFLDDVRLIGYRGKYGVYEIRSFILTGWLRRPQIFYLHKSNYDQIFYMNKSKYEAFDEQGIASNRAVNAILNYKKRQKKLREEERQLKEIMKSDFHPAPDYSPV